jgi:hypothetical protein
MDLPNPVIRSHYGNGFIKQYVRDHLILRTEAASNNVHDYGVNKSVHNLPALRNALSTINDSYLNVQQVILDTFIDRGQLRRLAEPTITPTGKRIPGLRLDHPRQLALMHALVRFAHVAAGNNFITTEIHPYVIKALGCAPERYALASLRYDVSKLRAKGLVAKLPNSRRYQLLPRWGKPERRSYFGRDTTGWDRGSFATEPIFPRCPLGPGRVPLCLLRRSRRHRRRQPQVRPTDCAPALDACAATIWRPTARKRLTRRA